MEITTIIGATGLLLLLVAFMLSLFNIVKQDSKSFASLNFLGWCVLVYYSYALGSVIFTVLSLVMAMFTLKDLINVLKK